MNDRKHRRSADSPLRRLALDPRYQQLTRRRSRFTWALTLVMLTVFFGYVLLIAFDRELLARPIGGGATTVGIPLGLGVIVLSIVMTGVYVWRANRDFDPALRELRSEHGE